MVQSTKVPKLETDKQGSERGVKLELERITIAPSANFVQQSRWFYPWSRFKYLLEERLVVRVYFN